MGQTITRLAGLAAGTLLVTTLGPGGAGQAAGEARRPAPVVFAGPAGTDAPAATEVARPDRQPAPQAASADERARAKIAFVYPASPPVQAAPTAAPAPTPVPAPQPRALAPTVIAPPVAAAPDPERDGVIQPVAGPVFDQVGMASWYGEPFHGRPTANGEIFDMHAMTAAHPSLPLPSLVQVINLENNREVVVRVNDRGPFAKDRILDLSLKAAEALDFVDAGETRVRIRYLGPAPVAGASAEQPPAGLAPAPAPEPANAPQPAPEPRQQPDVRFTPIAYTPPAPVSRARPAAQVQPAGRSGQGGGVYVQLGAFASISNAERLKSSLSANLPVAVQPARVNGVDVFRVLVGPWHSTAKAEAVRADLAARNFGPGMLVANP